MLDIQECGCLGGVGEGGSLPRVNPGKGEHDTLGFLNFPSGLNSSLMARLEITSLFLHIFKIDFSQGCLSGLRPRGHGSSRALGRSHCPALQLGRGLLPARSPADPEVLYSSSCRCPLLLSLFVY